MVMVFTVAYNKLGSYLFIYLFPGLVIFTVACFYFVKFRQLVQSSDIFLASHKHPQAPRDGKSGGDE